MVELTKPERLIFIGLTGGIACGKSTVTTLLAELGAAVLDADQVTRELQAPGQAVYRKIVAAFETDIVTEPNGPLDRRKLGALVFSDPAKLRRLEQIVHPAVRQAVAAWLDEVAAQHITAGYPVAVLDAIKLLEGGWHHHCDAVWVVTCAPEQQLKRLVETRGMSVAEATQRITAQPPQEERIAQADVVIDNSGTLEQTRQQVTAAWKQLQDGCEGTS